MVDILQIKRKEAREVNNPYIRVSTHNNSHPHSHSHTHFSSRSRSHSHSHNLTDPTHSHIRTFTHEPAHTHIHSHHTIQLLPLRLVASTSIQDCSGRTRCHWPVTRYSYQLPTNVSFLNRHSRVRVNILRRRSLTRGSTGAPSRSFRAGMLKTAR